MKDLLDFMELADRMNFVREYVAPLVKEGLLAMTNPAFPNSPKQRYVTTSAGKQAQEA